MTYPQHVASCDPSSDKQAVAHWWTGGLYILEFTRGETFNYTPNVFVCEAMRVYPGPKKEDPNDLIAVSEGAGGMITRCRMNNPMVQIVRYTAPDWKGQIKKPIHHQRLWDVLNNDERRVVSGAINYTIPQIEAYLKNACHKLAVTGEVKEYSWAAHNLFDAIGLGLFFLKRTTKGGCVRR